MRVVALLAIIVGFLGSVAAYVLLSIYHVDTSGLVLFLGAAGTTLIPTTVNMFKTHKVQQDVQTVISQTNGPFTEMKNQIAAFKKEIAGLKKEIHDLNGKG